MRGAEPRLCSQEVLASPSTLQSPQSSTTEEYERLGRDSTCRLEPCVSFRICTSVTRHIPSTMPPFHATKAANAATTTAYGRKGGRIWGRTFGTLAIDRSRSAVCVEAYINKLILFRKDALTRACCQRRCIIEFGTAVCFSESLLRDLTCRVRIKHPYNVILTESATHCS